MKKRGTDGCLFHYNRLASASLLGVCFPTRLWTPGRWDLHSVWLDIISSHLALHHTQWVLHEGWLNTCVNEWVFKIHRQTLNPGAVCQRALWHHPQFKQPHTEAWTWWKDRRHCSPAGPEKGTDSALYHHQREQWAVRFLFGDWWGSSAFLLSIKGI